MARPIDRIQRNDIVITMWEHVDFYRVRVMHGLECVDHLDFKTIDQAYTVGWISMCSKYKVFRTTPERYTDDAERVS